MESRKSEIKAFRFDSELVKEVRVAARREGVSENAFVHNLLTQRVKADPLIRAFPYIVLSRQSFAPIIGTANPDSLEFVAIDLGKKNFALARELYESLGMELGFSRYLVEVLGEQARWFETEGANSMPERMTLRHEYGMKWSLFLKSLFTGAYEVVSHERLKMGVTDTYVSMELPKTTW
jgi:hypothetical protein